MSRGTTPGFDRHITIFSPEGKLFQVEYAMKATQLDNVTAVGVTGKSCVVLAIQKEHLNKMIVPETSSRIFVISPQLGVAMLGRRADGKAQLLRAAQEATQFKYEFGYPMSIDAVVTRMSDINQVYTQSAELRPHGCSMLYFACDEEFGPCLYTSDPTGNVYGYYGCALGTSMFQAHFYLDYTYKKNMTDDETIQMAIECLAFATDESLEASSFELAMATTSHPDIRIFNEDEIVEQLVAINARNKKKEEEKRFKPGRRGKVRKM